MKSPCCDLITTVSDTRSHETGGVWRRRKCTGCDEAFTTLEQTCETTKAKRGMPFKKSQEPIIKILHPKKPRQPRILKAAKIFQARTKIEDMKMQKELDKLELG